MADERRPMGFWEQFNVWWRTTTTSTGERPRVDDIKRWYDANAGIVWPWGQAPTLEQTKKHAKGMRRLEDIPAYFREYRLKCKGQDHTEDGQDGSPPPPAHSAAPADGPTPADIPTATPSTNANNDSPKPQDHLHNARRNSSVATPTAAAAASPTAAAAAQRCPRTCPGPVARSRSRSLARRCGTHLRRPSPPSPGGASSDDWTPSCDEDEDERRHVARRQRRHSAAAAAAATHRSPAARRPSDPPANGTAATSAAQRQEQQQQQQEGKAEVLDTDKAHNSDNKADVVPNGGQQQKKQPWANGSDLAMSPRRQPHVPLPPLPYDNVQLPPAPAPESVSHAVGPPRAPSPPPLPQQQHAPSPYTEPPLGVPYAVASRTVRQYFSSVTAANGPPVLPPLRPLLHPAGSGVGEAEGDIPCFSASAHPPPMTPARVGRGAMPAHVPGPVFVPHEPIHNQYELPYHKHQLPYSHYSAYAPGPGPFPGARDEQCPPLSGPWGVIPPGAGCMRAGCASPWEGNGAYASAPPMGAWADCVGGPVPQLPFLPQERSIPMSGGCAIPNGDTYHAVVTSGWGAVAHSMPVSVGVGTGMERGAGVERAAGSSSLRKRNRSATVGGSSTSTLGSSSNNINYYNHVLNNNNSSSLSGSGSVAHSSTGPQVGPAPHNHNNHYHGDQRHQSHLSRGTHHRYRAGRHPNGTPARHTWGGAFPHATQHSLDHTAAAAAAAAAPGSSMYGMYDTYGTPGSTYPGSPATPPALADPWVGWVPNPVAHVEAGARMVPELMRMDVSPFVAAGHVLDTIHGAQPDQQQQHRRQQQHQQHSGPVVTTGFCPVPLPVASAHVADVSVPAPAPLRCETSVQLPVFYDHTPADQQQQQQQQLVPAFDSMSLEQLLPGLSGAGEGEIEAGLHDSELVGLDLFGGDLQQLQHQQLQHSMLGPGEVLVTLKVSPSGATAAAGTAKQQLTGGVGKERAAARGLPGAGGSGTGSNQEGGWAWGGGGDGGGGGGCGHGLMCLDVLEGECAGDGVVGMLPTPFSFVPLV